MNRILRSILITGVILSLSILPTDKRARVWSQDDICTGPHMDVSTPLNGLGGNPYIRMDGQDTGFIGGLYPGGSNLRPPAHDAAGVGLGWQVTPLGADGNPDPVNGHIVLLSIGVSNTWSEFDTFTNLAGADPEVNPRVFLMNGAQSSRPSDLWVDPNAETWQEVDRRLGVYGLTPEQVQLAWIKHTRIGYGDFPEMALALQSDLEAIVRNLKINYPNIKMAYLSSRTRSFTYWRGLSPEPTAFETGFAVRWLIEKQINGDPELNYDPALGEVKAPYLAWSAYLWIDGLNPRSDGLIWSQEDMTFDCTHPSLSGQQKVANMLLDFFKNDTTSMPWFLANPPVSSPTPTATATQTGTPTATATQTEIPTEGATPTGTSTATLTVNPGSGDFKLYMPNIYGGEPETAIEGSRVDAISLPGMDAGELSIWVVAGVIAVLLAAFTGTSLMLIKRRG